MTEKVLKVIVTIRDGFGDEVEFKEASQARDAKVIEGGALSIDVAHGKRIYLAPNAWISLTVLEEE